MNAGLFGAEQKVRRANEHLDTLKRELSVFDDPEAVPLRPQRNGDRTQEWWIVGQTKPVPENVPLIVGEIVHGFRSALDHLAFALASLRSRPHAGTSFPICTNREKFYERLKAPKRVARPYSHSSGMHKISGLFPIAQAFVEGCQPYHGGKYARLANLAGLDNTDKHRNLPLAFIVPKYWSHGAQPGVELEIVRTTLIEGAPFAKVTFDPDCTEVNVNLSVMPDVGFPAVSGWATEASLLMEMFRDTVQSILWDARPLFGIATPSDRVEAFPARLAYFRSLAP